MTYYQPSANAQLPAGMSRRNFICLAGVLIAQPLNAGAQDSKISRRVGLLTLYPEDDPESSNWIKSFEDELQRIMRQPTRIEKRWASSYVDRVPGLVDEILLISPEVILASTTPVVSSILRRSRDIPVVFVNVSDPVGSGFVASLSHPGGNVTGFVNLDKSLGAKALEYLYKADPSMRQVWMMYNPKTAPYIDYYRIPLEDTASSLGVRASQLQIRSRDEIESAVVRASSVNHSGIIVMNDSFTMMNRSLIAELVSRYKLPAVSQSQLFTRDGGLLTYGIDEADCYVRAAQYVARVLHGEKPENLPVQLPAKFKFVVNNRAAIELGLTIPASLLAIADDVID
jgi:putative ABC transport system substrate-binding protein